ncbi:MAG: glycosyltransferase family 39 protein, partial [Dehalococcoidia bacterium]
VLQADLDWVWADGRARLTIARSIVDNKQPGFTQFGNTWLPLHPALMLPFIWIDWAYRSGAAGIIVSVVSLVATIYYLHRFVYVITRSAAAAWVAILALALSPNFMFLAGTPMSETPFAALTMGAWFYLVLWSKDPANNQRALTAAGLMVGAAALIRYEAWLFVPAGVAFMVMSRLPYGERPTGEWQRRMEGELLAFVSLSVFPIFLFVVYNWLIFGAPNAFLQNNESAVAQQASGLDLTGNVRNVTLNLGYTILDNVGWIASAVAVAGLAVYAVIARRPVALVALILPATSLAFFALTLYQGGSVLRHDSVYEGFGLLNARYGVIAIPAAAVGIGVLAAFGRLPALIAVVVVVAQFVAFMTSPQPVITVRDATQQGYRHFEATATLFNEVYDGGDILMSLRDHAQLIPAIDIHLDQVMHEGVSQTVPDWEDALRDPGQHVRWIVIRQDGQGQLDRLISPVLLERDFEEVGVVSLENPHFVERIYRVRAGATSSP